METAFIIGIIGVWAIILIAKGLDWLNNSMPSSEKESTYDFLMRVACENYEREIANNLKKSRRLRINKLARVRTSVRMIINYMY